MADLEQRFRAAAHAARKLPVRPTDDQLLELYALYKQATRGDVHGARPGLLDPVGRAKHDAWTGKRGLAPDAAMAAYVALVDRLRKGA